MKPSDCLECRHVFYADSLLRTEIRHIAATEGGAAARMELDDRYEEEHDNEHEGRGIPS